MAKTRVPPESAAEARPARAARTQPATRAVGGPWPFWGRVVASVWVVWHLFVLFISPLSVPPATSALVFNVAQSPWVRWYSDPLYLNGGYHFFGPDPPLAGHLIRWRATDATGQPVEEGEFPKRGEGGQWPRLWYHRHMMLADQAADMRVYDDGDPASRQDDEQNLRLALRAYARHLLRKTGSERVELDYVEHFSLHPGDVARGEDPLDPKFYRTVATVTEERAALSEPLTPPGVGAEPIGLGDLPTPR